MGQNMQARHRDLNFSRNRLWSSPPELPLRNVIAVVLANPSFGDVCILCDKFGFETVKNAFQSMVERGEFTKNKKRSVTIS
jgi:hypothetical protein